MEFDHGETFLFEGGGIANSWLVAEESLIQKSKLSMPQSAAAGAHKVFRLGVAPNL
jgi:hypothetical protein